MNNPLWRGGNIVRVEVPLEAVWVNKVESEGDWALDGGTVDLEPLGTDARVGAAFIEVLSGLVVTSFAEAHC